MHKMWRFTKLNNGILLTEDDIQIEYDADKWYFNLDYVCSSEEEANNLKQQILNNQVIVEKIKQGLDDMTIFERAIKDKFEDSSYVPLESVVKGLRELIETTEHSECSTESKS